MKTETYILPAWVVTALVNDDFTGLSDKEERQLDLFINHELKRHKQFLVLCPNGEPEFMTTNDFDGLGGDCYQVEVLI